MMLCLDEYRHIHFVGAGGIGMSALAKLLLSRGFVVSGFDRTENGQTIVLRSLGARIDIGEPAGAMNGANLVVITPAAGGSPDVATARASNIPVIRRAELLGAIANSMRTMAVAGTHGKSTTSSLIAHICVEAGLDPTALIGAVVENFGSNARIGQSQLAVIEADEFDSAFLELAPAVGVITSAEPEHLDYFGRAERMYEEFAQFAGQVGERVFICADDAPVGRLTAAVQCPVVTYGLGTADWVATNVTEGGGRSSFRVHGPNAGMREYTMGLAGIHNVRNALAAIAVGHHLDIDGETISRGLSSFAGTERRFQTVGHADGVLVMDDYGHHPTEIRLTLHAMHERFNRPIRAIFQPHTYSRTHAFFDDFAGAFSMAHSVYLLDIYGARESDTLGVSARTLAAEMQRHHQSVVYTGDTETTLRRIAHDAISGDLVVTIGAGDVNELGTSILKRLHAREAAVL